MERDRILEKSRKEKRDEGKEFTFDKGRKCGVAGMLIIWLFLAVFNLYTNHKATNYALTSVFTGYLSCESFGIYYTSKRKYYFIMAFVSAVLCIYCLGIYLLG